MPEITPAFWIAAIILFSLIELATPQFLIIWFAFGSLAALITSLLGGSPLLQIIVFIAASVATLILSRPLYHKYLKTKIIPTNADSLIGKDAIVLETINNDDAVGLTKAGGQIWSARSFNGEVIKKGEKVKILSIEGVKLIVKLNENKTELKEN